MKFTKRLLTCILLAAMVLGAAGTATATNGYFKRDVYYDDISILLNGNKLTPLDPNGKVVEPFIIDGTTYLPVRALSEALGLTVGWDGATSTVSLDGSGTGLSASQIYAKVLPGVVHVDTGFSGGSGFFIEEDVVVTNNHVIKGAFAATVRLADGQVFNVTEVIATTENPDLALLRVDGKGTPLALSTEVAGVGGDVYTVGAPLGIFPTLSSGIIANNSYTENGTGFYLTTIGTISGNSGGAVINSLGQVIGVVQGGVSDGLNSLDMMIQAKHILEMDRSNPQELKGPAKDEENYTKASSLASAQVGQLVSFGRYEQDGDSATAAEEILWIVTDKNGSELTLMSLYALDMVPFMQGGGAANWADSYARSFLNNEFYNKAFNAAEKNRILTTTVQTNDNPVHGTDGGRDTSDKVWLPSLEEIMDQYGIQEPVETWYGQLYAQATPYTISKGVWLEIPGSTNCWWWLRSSGGSETNAAEVGSGGYLSFNGANAAETSRGLRPVIRVSAR